MTTAAAREPGPCRLLGVAFGAALALGCTAEVGSAPVEQPLHPTLTSALSAGEEGALLQTVRLTMWWDDGTAGSCTAALMGPRTVLTAGHCVVPASGASVTGGSVHVFANEGSEREVEAPVDIGRVLPHPTYPSAGPPPSEAYDVALVGLGSPVEIPIAETPYLRIGTHGLEGGTWMWLNGQMREGEASPETAFHQVVQLGALPESDSRYPFQLLAACTSTAAECAIQPGDSGGPLFREVVGEPNDGMGGRSRPVVYGVVSRIGSYARLDPVAPWIRETMEDLESASEPVVTEPDEPAAESSCGDHHTLESCDAHADRCAWYACASSCYPRGTPLDDVC